MATLLFLLVLFSAIAHAFRQALKEDKGVHDSFTYYSFCVLFTLSILMIITLFVRILLLVIKF
jgi:hypothetical protein